ncbi:BT4734/BF3469 family protein [uncultured Bacteroides sp.]|uniref:BT4734/BF3469 family protein n=1 Tax=uncultured Bacteroides sp. TaxID=162156 RepID=UPI00259176BA|nr:BT4734/BF3469 family protein [uncultured Bacteroides sp.]
MENIPVTTYRGFSAVSGETTFTQDMADIKNGKHAKLIIKIASLVAQGKVEEANRVKKQLPFRTLTANYRERRLAPGIVRYNPVITLDIDDLEEGQLEQTRTLVNEDPHTLGSFLSPKRHGYKLFVFMQTEYTRRLYDRLRQGEVTYATLGLPRRRARSPSCTTPPRSTTRPCSE